MTKQIDLITLVIENKLNTCEFFLEFFYNVTLRLSGTSYVTSNLLFFEIVAIHSMLRNLKEVVDTIDAHDEEGVVLEGMEYSVINFTEMTKRMRMKCNSPTLINGFIYHNHCNYALIRLDTTFQMILLYIYVEFCRLNRQSGNARLNIFRNLKFRCTKEFYLTP